MWWGLLGGIVGMLLAATAMQWWMGRRALAARGRTVTGVAGLTGRGTELVWFHSPTCGPCRVMEPAVRELARDHPVRIVDVTEDPESASRLSILATPSTVVVRDGIVVDVVLGMMPKGALLARLADAAGGG